MDENKDSWKELDLAKNPLEESLLSVTFDQFDFD